MCADPILLFVDWFSYSLTLIETKKTNKQTTDGQKQKQKKQANRNVTNLASISISLFFFYFFFIWPV